jgi:hypothetical protein
LRTPHLRRASPKFVEVWAEQAVRRFERSRKRMRHPSLGRIDLDYVKLAAVDDRQYLLVFLPADDASATKLGGPK